MDKEYCINKLEDLIIEKEIDFEEKIKCININDNQYIELDKFLSIFNDAELTYESLTNHQNCTDGWKETFNDWKKKGYIE